MNTQDQTKTGWPAGMLQDDSPELSRWLASKPDAKVRAREAGEAAANACTAKALFSDPNFVKKAQEAILAHLRVVGSASGETLTNVAIAHGARCADSRAFGSVFASLSRKHLIRTVGFCMREKGHGTAGGRIWGLVK